MGMDLATARHLALRLDFGATPAALSRLRRQDPDVAIQIRVANLNTKPAQPWPAWLDSGERLDTAAEPARLDELQRWWLRELVQSDDPLGELLVLAWQSHFGISARRAQDARAQGRLHRTLREHGATNFKALLLAVMREPATLLHLEANRSDPKTPAAAMAQALLTRYALPPGACAPEELDAAARALTGWHLDARQMQWRVDPNKHDDGQKTFLGRAGAIDGEGLLEILLEDPRVAEHAAATLWRAFVSEAPPPDQLAFLGGVLRDADYDLKPLLSTLLTLKDFLSERHRGALVRSPVELVVGAARAFYLPIGDGDALLSAARGLGQELLWPPDDGPWPTGRAWLYAGALARRQQALRDLLRGVAPNGAPAVEDEDALARWLGRPGLTLERARADVMEILLGAAPLSPPPPWGGAQDLILHAALDPQFQLK